MFYLLSGGMFGYHITEVFLLKNLILNLLIPVKQINYNYYYIGYRREASVDGLALTFVSLLMNQVPVQMVRVKFQSLQCSQHSDEKEKRKKSIN